MSGQEARLERDRWDRAAPLFSVDLVEAIAHLLQRLISSTMMRIGLSG